jgi:hypothetical protein
MFVEGATMPALEEKIIAILERKAEKLRRLLSKQGGRNVAVAEHIDRLDMAVDALRGELQCPHCQAQLTGK